MASSSMSGDEMDKPESLVEATKPIACNMWCEQPETLICMDDVAELCLSRQD